MYNQVHPLTQPGHLTASKSPSRPPNSLPPKRLPPPNPKRPTTPPKSNRANGNEPSTKTWQNVNRYVIDHNVTIIPFSNLTFSDLDGDVGTVVFYTCKWNNIKVVLKEYAQSEENEAIFLNELACLQKLAGSPYVLTVYGVCTHDTTVYYLAKGFSNSLNGCVVKYAENGDLRTFLKRSTLSWSEKMGVAYRLALGIKDLHDNHIVHGNLVSCNILVDESLNPIIADFKGPVVDVVEDPSDRAGNSLYPSDPSLPTAKPPNRTHDIYFLGFLLWEISAQRTPRVVRPSLITPLTDARETDAPGVPEQYAALYKFCWDNDPIKRPTIEQVVMELTLIQKQVDGMEDDLQSGRIREELKQELKKERTDRADACRTHWFAHRFMPQEMAAVSAVEEEEESDEREEENDQKILNDVSVGAIEKDIVMLHPQTRDNVPLLVGNDRNAVRHYSWIQDALSIGKIREIPYNDLQKDLVVGRGNYGTVYRAKWDNLDVAIKQYTRSEDLVHDTQIFVMLGRHPNIVAFFGVTKDPETEQYEIVLEYAKRGNMHDFWDAKHPLTWSAKMAMACDIACGLRHMHSLSVFHRGLDCENVLIRKNGSVALTGFSVSGIITDAARITEQLAYRGPNRRVDLDKSDIYSLGILLWEILFQKRAFEDNDYMVQLEDIMRGLRPGMDLMGKGKILPKDTPPDYVDIYTRCWDVDPRNWPAIEDVVVRLETLKSAYDNQLLCWEQLDSVCVGSDDRWKMGVEIATELKKICVEIIPYASLTLTKKSFRRGGFADIHVGSLEGEKVAVKAQLKHASDIIQEVRILRMVANHPNIVEFLGITSDANSNNYIIMHLAHMSLHEYVRSSDYFSKPWSAKVKIAFDVTRGLQHLHKNNIVHCDIHSGNVLIEQDGRAVLTDFGLSRTFAEAQQPEFRIKIYGRLGYLAPELLRRPPPAYSPVHDVFGLGVLLWEIASSDNPSSNILAINPVRLQRLRNCPSEEYQDLYQRCGAIPAEKRPGLEETLEVLNEIWEMTKKTVSQEYVKESEERKRVEEQERGDLPESMRRNLDNLVALLSVAEQASPEESPRLYLREAQLLESIKNEATSLSVTSQAPFEEISQGTSQASFAAQEIGIVAELTECVREVSVSLSVALLAAFEEITQRYSFDVLKAGPALQEVGEARELPESMRNMSTSLSAVQLASFEEISSYYLLNAPETSSATQQVQKARQLSDSVSEISTSLSVALLAAFEEISQRYSLDVPGVKSVAQEVLEARKLSESIREMSTSLSVAMLAAFEDISQRYSQANLVAQEVGEAGELSESMEPSVAVQTSFEGNFQSAYQASSAAQELREMGELQESVKDMSTSLSVTLLASFEEISRKFSLSTPQVNFTVQEVREARELPENVNMPISPSGILQAPFEEISQGVPQANSAAQEAEELPESVKNMSRSLSRTLSMVLLASFEEAPVEELSENRNDPQITGKVFTRIRHLATAIFSRIIRKPASRARNGPNAPQS